MRIINLKSKPNDKDWSMHFVDDSDYDIVYDEDVMVFKPDGQPLLAFRKGALTKQMTDMAWSVLHNFNSKTRNRGTAAGRKSEYILKKNGEKSTTLQSQKGWDVSSATVGYFERTARFPFCRSCAWNEHFPEKFQKLFPICREVSSLLAESVPDRYAVQKSYVDRTPKELVIPGTVFTTLTINKNFRTACHKDAGDLESGFSCLSVIRSGIFNGAKLVLPNWRIAVDLQTTDVVMFDAHEFHGNTQLVPISKGAQRCSIVFYYREKMVNCKSAVEELNIVKRKKRGEKIF